MRTWLRGLLVALAFVVPARVAKAADLGGSMASMRRQHAVAERNDYTFLRTSAQVRKFVKEDRLVPLLTNDDVAISKVSFPYARPAVVLFVERLAKQYHDATGTRLVVTSLTRPLSRQPSNAHPLSVHPTGMAVDLRVPSSARDRAWLERVLLQLESAGLLDATREHHPSHYHVAVFPERYEAYVATRARNEPDAHETAVITVASLQPSSTSGAAADGLDLTVAATAPVPFLPTVMVLGFVSVVAGGVGATHRRTRQTRD